MFVNKKSDSNQEIDRKIWQRLKNMTNIFLKKGNKYKKCYSNLKK